MLQIKTITTNGDAYFDEEVNRALFEGWQLTHRGVLPDGRLHAELEMEVITPNERNCSTCLYGAQNGGEPCDSCDEQTWDKWEPQEGAVVMVPLSKREEAE